MTVKKLMRIIPGFFIIFSMILGYFVNNWWYALTMFVGINLFQSGFTGICPLESILKFLRIPEE
jgi:hypothetical protein